MRIEKSDVIEHYVNGNMPMKLRMLGGKIIGTESGGQGGAGMVRMQMMMEGGGMKGMHTTSVDASNFMR